MRVLSGADWAKALRSGLYYQTKFALARVKDQVNGVIPSTIDPKEAASFCCLGVASKASGCEVLSYGKLIGKEGQELDWTYFANLNDRDGLTFPQIAEHVDELVDCVKFGE